MIKIFPNKETSKPLLQILIGIILLFILIIVIEFFNYILKESVTDKASEPIVKEIPLVIKHIVPKESFRFDPLTKSTSTPIVQFVLLSFDGSKSIGMWKDSLTFADQMKVKGKNIHFTYFVNSIYFLAKENKTRYTPPYGNPGDSAIGYAESLSSIVERVREVNMAIDSGHEIASHATGHWSGGLYWNVNDWNKELKSFDDILFNFKENNSQINFTEKLKINKGQIRGFRAPELSINNDMYTALSESGYYYDSSGVSYDDEWPTIDIHGIWHIPISTVYFKDMNKSIIAVDYSIWVNQTGGNNTLIKNTPEWNEKKKSVSEAYFNHFIKNYYSNKAPMVIDNHFSKWNDGLYWEAMKDFAEKVCDLPNVRCSTFSELVDYMETR